jgi:hypothetical protein
MYVYNCITVKLFSTINYLSMKELSIERMEVVKGGISGNCAASIGAAVIFGTGSVIAAASGPIGWLAFAMVGNYVGWGFAYSACRN